MRLFGAKIIFWTNSDLLSIEALEIYLNEIYVKRGWHMYDNAFQTDYDLAHTTRFNGYAMVVNQYKYFSKDNSKGNTEWVEVLPGLIGEYRWLILIFILKDKANTVIFLPVLRNPL